MWHFGPCVTVRPCQCHVLDLPMWLFGPEAVPCQWHSPPRIKKIYRNWLTIKRDDKINFNDRNNRRNAQTQEPRIRALARYFTSAFASVKYLSQRPHPRAKTWHKIWMTGLNPTSKSIQSLITDSPCGVWNRAWMNHLPPVWWSTFRYFVLIFSIDVVSTLSN